MRHARVRDRLPRDRESGQATVEFALILIPLLILVAGIIYFGIGLNYWLDMNRVANQGARFATVNNWPAQCPRDTSSGYSCSASTNSTACNTVLGANSHARLVDVLRCSPRNIPAVTVCFPGKDPAAPSGSTAVTVGDPVQVKLTAPYTFFFFSKARITLTARATMRLEQLPTLYKNVGGASGGPTCP